MEALCMAGAIALMLSSFVLLALAQERHWAGVAEPNAAHPSPSTQRSWRLCASAGLGAALALCIWSNGAGFGVILWVLFLALCAMAVALTLAFRPHWLRVFLAFARR